MAADQLPVPETGPPAGMPPAPVVPAVPPTVPARAASAAVVSATARPLDRRAVERVLARAAELQGGGPSEPDSDAIDEARLLEIAREAGLSDTSVRQALAEERTRIDSDADDARLATRLSGPSVVSASRVVTGTVAAAVAAIDSWMQREECLVVQRRFLDRMVWEPRSDWLGALKRGLRIGGRSYQLARARQVAATVVPVEPGAGGGAGRVLVRLDADISPVRAMRLRAGATAGLGGAAIAGSTVAMGVVAHAAALAVLGAAAIPLALGGGLAYALVSKHREFAARTALALEQVLDRLEHGDVRRTGGLLDAIAPPRPLHR